jgi:hypothetical protein
VLLSKLPPPKTPKNACHSLALARETILEVYMRLVFLKSAINLSIIVTPLQGYMV